MRRKFESSAKSALLFYFGEARVPVTSFLRMERCLLRMERWNQHGRTTPNAMLKPKVRSPETG